MTRDWHEWYREYDDPTSSMSRRLVSVRRRVGPLLCAQPRVRRVVSMCAGDGRDLLPLLAMYRRDAAALLIESDVDLAARARSAAAAGRLTDVVVRCADAGNTDAYAGRAPANLLLACGVFGNVSDDDLVRTVTALPSLLAPGAHVVWTRGCHAPADDLPDAPRHRDAADRVREVFDSAGFAEVSLDRPSDAGYRVGVHRLTAEPAPFEPGRALFTFV